MKGSKGDSVIAFMKDFLGVRVSFACYTRKNYTEGAHRDITRVRENIWNIYQIKVKKHTLFLKIGTSSEIYAQTVFYHYVITFQGERHTTVVRLKLPCNSSKKFGSVNSRCLRILRLKKIGSNIFADI